jgi:vacuolar protein sorting-associated protein 53
MSLIREKATESEAVVKDIQVLDLAKKTSMTMMKRLQMLGVYPAAFAFPYVCLIIYKLVNALTQMEELIGEKKYSEVAQTLSVSPLVYLQHLEKPNM